MSRIITHLLIFVVLFANSEIAVGIHLSSYLFSDQSELITETAHSSVNILEHDTEHCDDVNCSHCSHCSSHISGILPLITLPSLTTSSVLFSAKKAIAVIQPQAPPLRPPKA